MKGNLTMKKILVDVLTVLALLAFLIICCFILWVIISVVDTVLHNLDKDPVYLSWNLFKVLF